MRKFYILLILAAIYILSTLSACRPPDDDDNETDNATTLPTLVSTQPADTVAEVSISALEFTLSAALEVDRLQSALQLEYRPAGESQAYMVGGTVSSSGSASYRFVPDQPFVAGQYSATIDNGTVQDARWTFTLSGYGSWHLLQEEMGWENQSCDWFCAWVNDTPPLDFAAIVATQTATLVDTTDGEQSAVALSVSFDPDNATLRATPTAPRLTCVTVCHACAAGCPAMWMSR